MNYLLKLLTRNAYQREIHLMEHFSNTPEPTLWSKWFGGWVVPLLFAGYGLNCCLHQTGVLYGDNSAEWLLEGRKAVFYGIAWVSAGCFAHFHYFWPTLKRLGVFTDLGKVLSLLCLIASGGFVLWSLLKEMFPF